MRWAKEIAAAVPGYSHATVPVSSGQNRQPLPDAQPENGSWQGAVASGAKAETEDKEGFQSALQAWFEAYEGFLNERTVNEETGRIALHAQEAEKRVSEPETEPGLPVYLRSALRFGHPQHHQSAGRTVCRLKAQIGVSSRDKNGE